MECGVRLPTRAVKGKTPYEACPTLASRQLQSCMFAGLLAGALPVTSHAWSHTPVWLTPGIVRQMNQQRHWISKGINRQTQEYLYSILPQDVHTCLSTWVVQDDDSPDTTQATQTATSTLSPYPESGQRSSKLAVERATLRAACISL